MQSSFLEALRQRVLVWDGATGTQIQAADLQPVDFTLRQGLCGAADSLMERLGPAHLDGCNEILNLTRPDVIEAIHRRYYEAGSDIVETNTFGSTSVVMSEYDAPELVAYISRSAARIAVSVARELSTAARPRFVAGALGPGTKLVSLGQVGWDELVRTYQESFAAMLTEGVDVLLLETLQDLLMVKAGLVAAHRAMAETQRQVPIIVQVTLEQTGTMLLGSDIAAALNFVECFPRVVAFGMNCATGPAEMTPYVRQLAQTSTRPLSIQPNAGLPVMEKGQAMYKLTPAELADYHRHFVNDFGVALVGGCCGTTPDHIAAVAEAVAGVPHSADCHWRRVQGAFPGFDFSVRGEEQAAALALVGCSSLYQFQPYEQDRSFLIVGERTNANGSKAFREMLEAENWEGLTELAREQEGEGSHLLDVCTAFVGRNEERDMRTLLSFYNRQVTVPIMIDSTEAPVIEAALQTVAGKPLINSINFEDGEARTEKVLSLCRTYGAGVVALTIDEEGMAKTAERKLAIAERILDRTRAAGLADHDVFIDALTFTLGSGDEEFRNAGKETIDAIRLLKARFPRVNTILGISNISFGLRPAARVVLNSVFLDACRQVGLTSAIVHFSKIRPENQVNPEVWKIADDLVNDRRQFAAAGA